MLSIARFVPGRVFFIILLLASIYSVANYLIIRWIVTPNHLRVERKLAQFESERFTEALSREVEVLVTTAHDWAAWDDTHNFVQNNNREYITSNLSDTTLIDSAFNLLYIYRLDGTLAWGGLLDLETEEKIDLQELPGTGLPKTHPLLKHPEVTSSISGLINTALGPLIFASHPVVTSENQGPIVGTLMFGRLLSEPLLRKIMAQTKVDCRLIPLDNLTVLSDIPIDTGTFGQNEPYVFQDTENKITVYSLLPDYQGGQKWLLEVQADRLITSHTKQILRYVLLSNCALGFVVLFLAMLAYKTQIWAATSTFRGLIDQSLPGNRVELQEYPKLRNFSSDEFSRLSQDLRSMIDSFEQTRAEQENIISRHTATEGELNSMLVQEIKERLKIEENLQRIQGELEGLVDKRTQELQQTNRVLKKEIEVRKTNENELREHQKRLRTLSSELLEMEDKERRKIATDLHDHIGQSISVVKMYVDGLVSTVSDDDSRKKLQQIANIVDKTIQDTRTLTFELSPPILYELGLDAALDWLVEEFEKKYSMKIASKCDVLPKATTFPFLALIFRTIRELLMNIVRHAETSFAEVSVRLAGQHVLLTVMDNGHGMQKKENNDVGFGLFSIRERISNIGGTVNIDSQLGKGTTVTLKIPIQEDCSSYRS